MYKGYFLILSIVLIGTSGDLSSHIEEIYEEIVVTGRKEILIGDARSASEGVIGQYDINRRPFQRTGDILETVPGLIVTQHSGSGKSNQLYLRGFNLDHGTDFATWIDGMPVNMRSHAHGQGYTDINFFIPELIEKISFVKGPYHSEIGDFSSAGSAHIHTFDELDLPTIKMGVGENGFSRVLLMGTSDTSSSKLTGALEINGYDGPWKDIKEDVKKANGFFKLTQKGDLGERSVLAMIYKNDWNSSDQIPSRAITNDLIDNFGSLDKTLGGSTKRISLSSEFQHNHRTNQVIWRTYIINYELDLWSNFTYYLDSPNDGDQFKQKDKRNILGGSYTYQWIANSQPSIERRLGVDFRHDMIDELGLYQTKEREILKPIREDQVKETSLSAFYEVQLDMISNWRAVIGFRADAFEFEVTSKDYDKTKTDFDYIVSPKLNISHQLSDSSEMYLSFGNGFHSNDARGVLAFVNPLTSENSIPADPLVKSSGIEWGIKTLINEELNTSFSIWSLDLDSELLFVGDAGTTEPSRPSKRWGIEFNNFWSIDNTWSLEADYAYSNAKFDDQDNNRSIPGALKNVASLVITAEYPSGITGSLSFRYLGKIPLTEDGSIVSNGSALTNLSLGWPLLNGEVQLNIFNLFDSDDHDVDYFYTSRLEGEPLSGIEDIHYHIFEGRQIRLSWMREF